jgi:hypothetical protein
VGDAVQFLLGSPALCFDEAKMADVMNNVSSRTQNLRFLCALSVAIATAPALATDVGVSVSVGQPGFYGRIEIGSFPQPQLIYAEPVVIQPVPVGVVRQPIYLHVAPGHAKNWRKHCAKYNACGQPVYFVQESWYNDVYVPRYRASSESQGKRQGKGHGKGHKND